MCDSAEMSEFGVLEREIDRGVTERESVSNEMYRVALTSRFFPEKLLDPANNTRLTTPNSLPEVTTFFQR